MTTTDNTEKQLDHPMPEGARKAPPSGGPMSYLPRNEPAGNIDRCAATPVMAGDQRQADYYLRALTRSSREIERRIASYQAAMARYEASGDADYARCVRRQIRIEQQDRYILERMIDNLRRRFAPRDHGAVSPRSRRGPRGSKGVSGSGPEGMSVRGAGSACNAIPYRRLPSQ